MATAEQLKQVAVANGAVPKAANAGTLASAAGSQGVEVTPQSGGIATAEGQPSVQTVAGAAGSAGSASGGGGSGTFPYNYQARIDEIGRMYDSQLASQRAQLESAYNQNMSDLEANRGKIREQYRTQRNMSAASYERNRRNFNQQAIMNGINTGAGSQAALSQNSAYQGALAALGTSEANANTDLEKTISDTKAKYQSDIQQAIATNDYNRAAALLDEYNNAYSQAMTEAQTRAQYGDFSGYAAVYGRDAARQMEQAWKVQNPAQAYAMGKMTAQQYRKITGAWPPGYKPGKTGGSGRGYSRGPGGTTPPPQDPPDTGGDEGEGVENPFATGGTGGYNVGVKPGAHYNEDRTHGRGSVDDTERRRAQGMESARRRAGEEAERQRKRDAITERWAYAQGLV